MTTTTNLTVRELEERDLESADRICRVAFGTYLGVPEPELFFGDTAYVRTRYHAPNTAAFVAELDGEVVGSNFVTNWGSVGFFGPLSVRVDLWDGGIASALMEETMGVFSRWGTRHAALFTWADSAKHHALYGKYGFHPTFLTAVMSRPVRADGPSFDDAPEPDHRRIADQVYAGLDLSGEVRSVAEQHLGGTVALPDGEGFAICHAGSGTEAGGGACYVKFAAVRTDVAAFNRLVDVCEAFARGRGAERLVVGVNMGRVRAYRSLAASGFRTDLTGVAMQQDGEHAYNRPESLVIDDWR